MKGAPYEEKERLLCRAAAGDEAAQEKLYEMNRGLIYKMAQRFAAAGYDYEELFQVGSIGLLHSIRNFDPSYGVQFSTYAVPLILGEMRRFIRENHTVRVQRSVKETYTAIRRTEEALYRRMGKIPTVEEISREMGLEREAIVEALEAFQPPRSMDEALEAERDGSSYTLLERMESRENGEEMLEKLSLQDALRRLPDRERMILQRRFFAEETQAAIAGRLGISQVQVSRLEKRALKHLRQNFS